MLKITRSDLDSTRTALRLEGRVTEAGLPELERARMQCQQEGRHLILDLAGVSFVDRGSVATLHALRRDGIAFTGCSPFVLELLKEEAR